MSSLSMVLAVWCIRCLWPFLSGAFGVYFSCCGVSSLSVVLAAWCLRCLWPFLRGAFAVYCSCRRVSSVRTVWCPRSLQFSLWGCLHCLRLLVCGIFIIRESNCVMSSLSGILAVRCLHCLHSCWMVSLRSWLMLWGRLRCLSLLLHGHKGKSKQYAYKQTK